MSQYPNPYQQPPPQQPYPPQGGPGQPMGYGSYPQQMYPDLLAPARQASILMLVLGAFGLLCGLCMGLVGMMPVEKMLAEQGKPIPQMPPGVTIHDVQRMATYYAVVAVPLGIFQIITGIFIRRGRAGAAVVGIVLASLNMLFFAINAIGAIIYHQGIASAFISALIGAAYGWMLALCIKVRRNAPHVGQLQASYQAQYWQHMQQMQANQAAYNAAGYGQSAYTAPAAPPPQGSTGQTAAAIATAE